MIERIKARKIEDSRGNPTIEIDLQIKGFDNIFRVAAPSGASVGEYEAVAFPNGVDKCVRQINENVGKKLVGLSPDITDVDRILRKIDGTDNFSNIGGNPAMAISIAVSKAAAFKENLPLYAYINNKLNEGMHICDPEMTRPLGNVLGGGKHAIGGTDIQEFLVCSNGHSAIDNILGNVAVHKKVGEKLKKKLPNHAIGRGDEGAWVAHISNEDALEIVSSGCIEASDELGFAVNMGLDIAASSLWDKKKQKYVYHNAERDQGEQIDFILELIKEYKLYFVEDPVEENDYSGFSEITKKVKGVLICGDDIFVTNSNRLEKGVKMNSGNTVLIKPNQIGTLSDTMETIRIAKKNDYGVVVSHRSGETTDDTIAHLAVGAAASMLKTGVVGGERIAKLNELIRIEEGMKEVI